MATLKRRQRSRGFSLIELLIATAIAGLVIGVATVSFSLFSQAWGRFSAEQSSAMARLQRMELVEASVRSAVPWIVRDQNGRPGYYFLGREEGLTLVSTRAVFAPGELAVIRLFREREVAGSFRLVYEEAPLDAVLLRRADQVLPFKHRVIVATRLEGLSFRYFGWESSDTLGKSIEDSSLRPLWFDEFDGLVRGVHPSRIGIILGGNESVYFIPERYGFAFE